MDAVRSAGRRVQIDLVGIALEDAANDAVGSDGGGVEK